MYTLLNNEPIIVYIDEHDIQLDWQTYVVLPQPTPLKNVAVLGYN